MVIREVPARIREASHSSVGSVTGFIHTLRICLALLIDRMERKFPGQPDRPAPRDNQEARE